MLKPTVFISLAVLHSTTTLVFRGDFQMKRIRVRVARAMTPHIIKITFRELIISLYQRLFR
jgi:hypothetical protein